MIAPLDSKPEQPDLYVTNPRPNKNGRSEVRRVQKSAHENHDHAKRVGLKPREGWHKRNFVTEVLIPSLFTKRANGRQPAVFPRIGQDQIAITWIGHASFLIEIGGQNILIDPNWANWLKVVKRLKEPGLHLHDLPNIDLVLVTHAHFDHLDRKTLRNVASDQPIMVPFGVGDLVHDLGFNVVHELDWWQSETIGDLEITLTPCHHWGARMLHDSHRGFGGFHVRCGERSLLHCGDTAMFDGFEEIGSRCPTELALLPIGAYDPPSGREVHMNPEQAVEAFVRMRARRLIPMHYGTFRLSFEPVDEPLQRLLREAGSRELIDQLTILTEGKTVVL